MGFSVWQLLIILLIILLLFGTKRLRNIGEDMGNALRSFRKGMHEEEKEEKQPVVSDAKKEASTEKKKRKPTSGKE